MLRRDDGDVNLAGLFVEPKAWREGIGARLVREAERLASGDGATSLNVIANPRAEAFYLACGFEFVGKEQTHLGIVRTMRKPLIAGSPQESS